MSARARQIRERRKRDPYAKGAQLAPRVEVPAPICAREGCGHLRLVHDHEFVDDKPGGCGSMRCLCTEYVEAS